MALAELDRSVPEWPHALGVQVEQERRERVKRTEAKIRGLVDFIAQGDRSEYVW